jgi:hypothetical protein
MDTHTHRFIYNSRIWSLSFWERCHNTSSATAAVFTAAGFLSSASASAKSSLRTTLCASISLLQPDSFCSLRGGIVAVSAFLSSPLLSVSSELSFRVARCVVRSSSGFICRFRFRSGDTTGRSCTDDVTAEGCLSVRVEHEIICRNADES